MVLLQGTILRTLLVYIGLGTITSFFIYIGIRTLMANKKKMGIMFSCFFFVEALGITINLIYAPLKDENLIRNLHYLAVFFIIFGLSFLLVFCLEFYKDGISLLKQLLILGFYGFLAALIYFIPGKVIINSQTGWYPQWSINLFVYVLIILILMYIPTFYYLFKIYFKFEDVYLKKKWKFAIFGIGELYFLVLGIFISNTLNNPLFRTIWAPIAIILSISGAYLVYDGIAKKFK